MATAKKCCLCGGEYNGYGNNPEPLKKGRCCDKCNITKVVPARMKVFQEMECWHTEIHIKNCVSCQKNYGRRKI